MRLILDAVSAGSWEVIAELFITPVVYSQEGWLSPSLNFCMM